MATTPLDDLQIKISVNVGEASKKIQDFAKRLSSLDSSLSRTPGLDRLLTSLHDINEEGGRLSTVANGLREIVSSLNAANRALGVAQSMQNIANEAHQAETAIQGVQEAAAQVQPISGMENPIQIGSTNDLTEYISLMDVLGREFGRIGDAARQAGSAIISWVGRAAKAPFNLLGNAISKVTDKLHTLGASVKRIAFYRMIRAAIKGVTQALKEGVQMLIEWDRTYGNNTSYAAKTADEIAAKWREVKKSLGAAAMPIIQVFQPALMSLMQMVIDVANTINQVIRSFQGFSTYIKATDKGFKSAAGSAKELKNTLFGFDELNVLPSASGGGASSSAGAIDFEEVGIDSLLAINLDGVKQKFSNFFEEIRGHIDQFKQSVSEGGLSFSNFAELIGGIAGSVGKFVGGIFKDLGGTIKRFVSDFGLEGTTIGNIIDEIGNVFINFGDLVEGIFTLDLPKIVDSLHNIVDSLMNIVSNAFSIIGSAINSFFDWLGVKMGIDFSGIKKAVEGLMLVMRVLWDLGLGSILHLVIGWGELLLKFLGGDLVGNVFRILNGVIQFIGGVFSGDFETALLGLEEIGKGAANIVIGAVELIVNAILEPIRAVARAINNFKISIPEWIPLVGGKSWNPQVKVPERVSIERFAEGGFMPDMPNVGSLFMAGEQGAELVMHAPGGTEVLNGNQVEEAMSSANIEVINAIYAMANMVVGAVNNKNFDVYMDAQKVGKSVSQYQLNYARQYGG